MTEFVARYRAGGLHIHVRLFVRDRPDGTAAYTGTITLRDAEWITLLDILGDKVTIEEEDK